jgi:hypothetical protein
MSERRKLSGWSITRSIQDRIFLGVMGLLFMLPTGYMLYNYHTKPHSESLSPGIKLLFIFVYEVIATIFVLALCAFIWGIAAPKWIERFFEKALSKFALMILLGALIVLGAITYGFLTL